MSHMAADSEAPGKWGITPITMCDELHGVKDEDKIVLNVTFEYFMS